MMDPGKRAALEAAGCMFTDAEEFLGLADEERRLLLFDPPSAEMKTSLGNLRDGRGCPGRPSGASRNESLRLPAGTGSRIHPAKTSSTSIGSTCQISS